MPTYQYACTDCNEQLEVHQSFTDDALTECPRCEGRLRKIFNAVGVVFKGSGFYKTDSRSNGTGASSEGAEAGSSSAGSDAESSTSGKDSGSSTGSDAGSGTGSTNGSTNGSSGGSTSGSTSKGSGSKGSDKTSAA